MLDTFQDELNHQQAGDVKLQLYGVWIPPGGGSRAPVANPGANPVFENGGRRAPRAITSVQ